MEKKRDEKNRALNIIWNASDDYSFQPDFKVYDEMGKADIYWNYVIGAARKYYDYSILHKFFTYLKKDSDHEFYEKLTWIGLENCIYIKGKRERPVIESLRLNYAIKLTNGDVIPFGNHILDAINMGHFRKALGLESQLDGRMLNILNDLEFDENMSTEDIVQNMKEILEKYFRFNYGQYEISVDNKSKFKKNLEISEIKQNVPNDNYTKKDNDNNREEETFIKDFIVSAEMTGKIDFDLDEETINKEIIQHKTINKRIETDRKYIEKYYGTSILSELKVKSLEKVLCVGNHNKSHLYFTRGEFNNNLNDVNVEYRKKVFEEQRENNLTYYHENYARNNNSILNLTNKILNTMLVYFESYFVKSKTGKIAGDKIWRNIYLNDDKIFTKKLKNDIGNITVDIMLDASASQVERQKIIAAQGYIIAESFTRCQIPVKVYSFNSLSSYTIINLYRDYDETDKNDRIFNYNTIGSNRDGLAIRTAMHMMENSLSEHKILIVLSDCKPNDINIIPATGIIPVHYEYSGSAGVNDTAVEVKKGINKGNSILCVFTGEDEDVPSAKKIFGHNFVRISTLDRFADIVGVLMQNQLKSL